MHRAQIAIGETPPTAGQAENGFRPELRRGHVHENQRTARREQMRIGYAGQRARRLRREARWCR